MISYGNCSHFWDIFPNISNNVKQISLKISSYIHKNTQNPMKTSKISICNTKHTTNAKIHFKFSMFLLFENLETKRKHTNDSNTYFIIYQFSIIHILYILYILYNLYILYICVQIHRRLWNLQECRCSSSTLRSRRGRRVQLNYA